MTLAYSLLAALIASCACFGQDVGCGAQPASGMLHLTIVSLNKSTGTVQVTGGDSRGPQTPFTWNWGDGVTTTGFFPLSHTYANVTQNYVLQVTAHENDGSTDCAQINITFVAPKPITGGYGFSPPQWTAIGPALIPNAHGCDNAAEASLPGAGKVQAFAIDLSNPAVMYAGGGIGPGNSGPASNSGIYKSIDGGAHWTSQNQGLTDRYISALWLDQSKPGILLASTWYDGIFRSTDGAQSWNNVLNLPATAITQAGQTLLAAVQTGVVKSTDGGLTWSMEKAASSPGRALACTGEYCYAGLDDGTVLVRTRAGAAWTTSTPVPAGATIWVVTVNPVDPTEAIVTANKAGALLNRITRDGGATWSDLPLPSPRTDATFPCLGTDPTQTLAFDTVNPKVIYSGFGSFLWVSRDDAASWTPQHFSEDLRLIYPFPGQSGKLVAGGDQGIFLSTDTGVSWRSLNGDLSNTLLTHLAVNGSEILTAVQDYSPILSFDSGASWLQLSGSKPPEGEDGVVVVNPGNPKYQYCFNTSGLWYSTDGGLTFTNDNDNLPVSEWSANGSTDYIAVDPAKPLHLYLEGSSGVFESTDGGIHWKPTKWPIANPTFVVMDPRDANTIFVGGTQPQSQNRIVIYSKDGGATWKSSSLPANSSLPLSLAIDPADSNSVLLGMSAQPDSGSGAVLVSKDGGKTFVSDNEGLIPCGSPSGRYVGSIRFAGAPNSGTAAVATACGLYISHPGNPWTDITGNALPHWFTGIAWTADSLYVSTYGQGVLKAPISAIVTGDSPQITSVNTASGGPTIAPNTWIEIKGKNLVPANTPSTDVIWNSAPEFASQRMPTQLNSVSVKVNGKPAYVYFYCSQATSKVCNTDQINVLTPLDSASGPVTIVVTSGAAVSAPFNVEMRNVSPSLLTYSSKRYVVATHADFSLVGPADAYPGVATSARPNETVVVYAVGFGLPSTPLLEGSALQSGSLPSAVTCEIGGAPATIAFAGLISPGLYQLNLIVPSSAADGDSPVTCHYAGANTPDGNLISIRK